MRKWSPAIFIAASLAFSLIVFERLPDRMTVRWSMGGQADRLDSKWIGAFIMPALMLLTWGLARVAPRIDPRRESYQDFRNAYDLMISAIIAFLALMHVGLVGHALGWNVSLPRLVPLGVGALMVILGNLLQGVRPNWFVGIRTPWTLSNDRVWERTHRVGGAILSGTGVLVMLAFFAEGLLAMGLMFGGIVAAAIATVGYSYLAWREEVGRPGGGPPPS